MLLKSISPGSPYLKSQDLMTWLGLKIYVNIAERDDLTPGIRLQNYINFDSVVNTIHGYPITEQFIDRSKATRQNPG